MEKIFKGMENGPEAIDSNFNELADPKRDQTINDLTVNGQFVVNPNQTESIIKFTDNTSNLIIEAHRINNDITVKFNGDVRNLTANSWIGTIPLGYRPAVETRFPVISIWSKLMMWVIKTDGTILTTSFAEDSNQHGVEGTAIYKTKDAMPS